MIDPMVSLAFSVYSKKGTYALLLGSGISQAAGIPTGWDITLDLIKKAAKLGGEDCAADPESWFRAKYKADPDYSKLLDALAKTSTERQQILGSYFEPTDDERAQGRKMPSAGHKAIAELMRAGYLRVILTTNFDRLMELALTDVGVTPTVISNPDQLKGALPLVHSGATIIKLHGDYLDTRIKNTPAELATYEAEMDAYLDRVLDDYGLIVCGWSGDWDLALRSALERCPSRRFTTFWTARSTISQKAKQLVDHRQAEVIRIQDADHFFQDLVAKVQALDELGAPHPMSTKMAVAMLKRYLVDPAAKIRLRDLVHDETERVVSELNNGNFPFQFATEFDDEFNRQVTKYETVCERLIHLVAAGCYLGGEQHDKLWIGCLNRVANARAEGAGITSIAKLRLYPALLLLYSAGIASVASENYRSLAAALLNAKLRNDDGTLSPLCASVYLDSVFEQTGDLLPDMKNKLTSVSGHLFRRLRGAMREFIPSDQDYETAFDRFEYFFAIVHADLVRREYHGWYGPVGCFWWRGRLAVAEDARIPAVIGAEIQSLGTNWPPIKAGFFSGSLEHAQTAKAKFDEFLSNLRRR